MNDILDPTQVRNGSWGELWLDGHQRADVKSFQLFADKERTQIARCGTLRKGSKLTGIRYYGRAVLYNASDDLAKEEMAALAQGRDLRHKIVSKLDDPDSPNVQRVAAVGISIDKLTLADWEAAVLGEVPFDFEAEDAYFLE